MIAPAGSRSHPLESSRRILRAVARVRTYIALTRPRVLALVLFTAPPALALGHGSWPSPVTLLGVLLGVALVGGGCGALNAWIERDADALMARTRDRPLPTGQLEEDEAILFGAGISLAGLLVLLASGGWLAAGLGLLTLLHYIGVYTLWLKPRSPQNIVIGGAAGAAAPLIADAARDGTVGIWGIVLFAIIFLWTPPHFWAIALSRREEYDAAGFPMMPAVVGEQATRWRMLAYALLLIPVSMLPWFGGTLGLPYATAAILGGGWFVVSIVVALRTQARGADRRVFHVSIAYLSALFAVMLLELILG